MTKPELSSKDWFEKTFRGGRLELRLKELTGETKVVQNGKVYTLDAFKVEIFPSTKHKGKEAVDLDIPPLLKAERLQRAMEKICSAYGVERPEIHRRGNDILFGKETISQMQEIFRKHVQASYSISDAIGGGVWNPPFESERAEAFAGLEGKEDLLHHERMERSVKLAVARMGRL